MAVDPRKLRKHPRRPTSSESGFGTTEPKGYSVAAPSVSVSTPSAPVWTPPPSDSTLEGQYAAYDKQAQISKGGYVRQAQDLLKDYGFQAGADAFSYGAVDPNNPFSKAMLLKQSFDRAKLGNTNSYAARGQLYSGAAQRAQDKALNDYQAGDNALRGALNQSLGGLGQAYAGVDPEIAGLKAGAYGEFQQRQFAMRPPLPDPPAPQPAYGTTAPVAVSQKAQKTTTTKKPKKGRK